jgi:hypothetical protein
MADITIASGTTFTLSAPLTGGTNIDFLNNAGNSSELFIEPGAFELAGGGYCEPQSVSASIGGIIENFQPGDTIAIANIDQVFADLNRTPFAGVEDLLFDVAAGVAAHFGAQISIASNGVVTDNFGLSVNGVLQTVFDDLRSTLFGVSHNPAITLAFQPSAQNGANAPNVLITDDNGVNPCFVAGTRILTARGEIAVEQLVAGDIAITHAGEEREIVWIGRREIDIARHPRPETVLPVIIEAGALADNSPANRLTVSPDHALFIDNVLVQAKDIINGVSIRQVTGMARVRYFHVELDQHDILFAEGAPAESYLDTGHRGVFDNADAPLILHPDLMQIRREEEGCAPLCMGGETLFRIRERLSHRSWRHSALGGVAA